MSFKKIYAIIRREYLERVRTKAFWIGTALIPILLFGYVFVQIASNRRAAGDRRVAVVDLTGRLYEPLVKELAAKETSLREGARREGPGDPLGPREANASRRSRGRGTESSHAGARTGRSTAT